MSRTLDDGRRGRPSRDRHRARRDGALEALRELAQRGKALLGSSGTSVTLQRLEDTERSFIVQRDQRGVPDDVGLIKRDPDDGNLDNDIRIDGGSGRGLDEATADSVEDVVDYQCVTENDPLTYQLNPRPSRIASCPASVST